MDQAITATISRFSPIVAAGLMVLSLLTVAASPAHARASGERAVGIVDQPCSPSTGTEPKASDSWLERLLDPSAGPKVEAPDPNSSNAPHPADEERLHHDWAQLCRY